MQLGIPGTVYLNFGDTILIRITVTRATSTHHHARLVTRSIFLHAIPLLASNRIISTRPDQPIQTTSYRALLG